MTPLEALDRQKIAENAKHSVSSGSARASVSLLDHLLEHQTMYVHLYLRAEAHLRLAVIRVEMIGKKWELFHTGATSFRLTM